MTTAADLSPAAVEACIELVREQRHGVSFPELRTVCDDLGVLTAGDAILGAAAVPGVVLWAAMSGAFAEIVAAVHAHTSTGLVAYPRPVLDAEVASTRTQSPPTRGRAGHRTRPATVRRTTRRSRSPGVNRCPGAPKLTGSTSRPRGHRR